MSTAQIVIFEPGQSMHEAAAAYVQQRAEQAIAQRNRFYFVLSGGGTPRPLYRLLASPTYRHSFPWAQTHLFWSDERTVSPTDPESNYGMVRDLLLNHVDVPHERIHRVRGELEPALAAEAYEQELLSLAENGNAWPHFDLVLLGLGSDGHTASLFPGSTHPVREAQPVLAVTASYGGRPAGRVTLTPPALNDARNILFLVSGSEKAGAVAATLQGPRNPSKYPAQRIHPADGAVTWFVDRDAAAKLDMTDKT
ncbi:MAG TPA: 6-phosphogluconolactonase [Candidatus Sulfomarinibacteraceae bacterium]|nr:6-phosphogluconolactonase [Candidatus Sulfomarinibacteraceae bacterium]